MGSRYLPWSTIRPPLRTIRTAKGLKAHGIATTIGRRFQICYLTVHANSATQAKNLDRTKGSKAGHHAVSGLYSPFEKFRLAFWRFCAFRLLRGEHRSFRCKILGIVRFDIGLGFGTPS